MLGPGLGTQVLVAWAALLFYGPLCLAQSFENMNKVLLLLYAKIQLLYSDCIAAVDTPKRYLRLEQCLGDNWINKRKRRSACSHNSAHTPLQRC
uniref:Putative secreted protein n=1 Tax=Ixodes ricinus TaxID=34613 RepID=A0A6B0UHK1_IXORI